MYGLQRQGLSESPRADICKNFVSRGGKTPVGFEPACGKKEATTSLQNLQMASEAGVKARLGAQKKYFLSINQIIM